MVRASILSCKNSDVNQISGSSEMENQLDNMTMFMRGRKRYIRSRIYVHIKHEYLFHLQRAAPYHHVLSNHTIGT